MSPLILTLVCLLVSSRVTSGFAAECVARNSRKAFYLERRL